jgi:MFS family permease
MIKGLVSPLLGNTAVHLERLFEVNTATMSLTFTLHMAGYMTGSVVCGFIYDHFNHELGFTAANLIEGLATIIAPFIGGIGGLPAFIAVMFVQAMGSGFVDAGMVLLHIFIIDPKIKDKDFWFLILGATMQCQAHTLLKTILMFNITCVLIL